MATKSISVSGFDFTGIYPVADLFKPLEKIGRPQGRIFEIFWVKVQKFKKSLRELGAKIQKSVFLDFSNFSYLPARQTLATYIEDKTSRTFSAPAPERWFGRKFCKFANVHSLRPYISKSKPDRTVKISDFTASLPYCMMHVKVSVQGSTCRGRVAPNLAIYAKMFRKWAYPL